MAFQIDDFTLVTALLIALFSLNIIILFLLSRYGNKRIMEKILALAQRVFELDKALLEAKNRIAFLEGSVSELEKTIKAMAEEEKKKAR
ncbi:MAG: hypothetical protein PHH08_03765 [Candidatus ainarchaeum sp.]|nr:hypothetical protein [Candidatus ainarchaeum sp.]